MNALEIKKKLLTDIQHANQHQIEDIYGLVLNYFNEQNSEDDWNKLTTNQQVHLENSLLQAQNNESLPLNIILSDVKAKYGLND